MINLDFNNSPSASVKGKLQDLYGVFYSSKVCFIFIIIFFFYIFLLQLSDTLQQTLSKPPRCW